jgi:hypothetical protein
MGWRKKKRVILLAALAAPAGRPLREPLYDVASIARGCLGDRPVREISERVLLQFVAQGFFSALHDRVDRAHASRCPRGCLIVEHRTARTYFAAFEERFVTVNCFDDVPDRNLFRGTRKRKTAANSFSGHHQFGLGQFGEQLRQIVRWNTLEFRQIAHAGFLYTGRRVGKVKEAVQTVFNASANEGHVKIRT